MAAGVRSLLVFWLGGAASGVAPLPTLPLQTASGGRLTARQIRNLRGQDSRQRHTPAEPWQEDQADEEPAASVGVLDPPELLEPPPTPLPLGEGERQRQDRLASAAAGVAATTGALVLAEAQQHQARAEADESEALLLLLLLEEL